MFLDFLERVQNKASSLYARLGDRQLLNEKELLLTLNQHFSKACLIQTTVLGGPIVRQLHLLASTSVLISVSGSGSHMMMWLPDGATSIQILHPTHGDVNQKLCSMTDKIFCKKVSSRFPHNISIPDSQPLQSGLPVIVDLSELCEAISGTLRVYNAQLPG